MRPPTRPRDVAAVLILGLLPLSIRARSPQPWEWSPDVALLAGLDPLLLNPASTTENLFSFGFLADRLETWTGRWGTPLLVAALYTAHEMSNPEYWYEGMRFPLVFVAVAVTAAVFRWCRNTVSIWLGDGLVRVVVQLG